MGLFRAKKEEFVIPIHGILRSLQDVQDQVFSKKVLGDGFAIEPLNQKTTVIAPFSGVLSVCFPTKHAYGIQTKDGKEILLHLGIDTVELNGEGFTCHVVQGQKVKQGDLLCTMDLDVIRLHGKSVICPIIVTSGQTVAIDNCNGVVALQQSGVVSITD